MIPYGFPTAEMVFGYLVGSLQPYPDTIKPKFVKKTEHIHIAAVISWPGWSE